DLSGNEINTISQRDFDKLHSLEKLHLTGNEIGDLPDDIFPEDNVVEILDLRLNRLRLLTPDYFSRLRNLRNLGLSSTCATYWSLLAKEPGLRRQPEKSAVQPFCQSNACAFEQQRPCSLVPRNLDGNNLEKVSATYFAHLSQLQTLKLGRNRIYYTEDNSFITLSSLKILDLSSNFIRKIPSDTFTGLWNLSHLDLQQNQIVWIEDAAFTPLVSLASLYFDTFFMCAYARHVAKCEPESDGISSRDNLLESGVLRTAVWVVAVLACVGNMAVLMGRLIMKEDNHVHSFLIKNLSLADLLMGVYLFVLATHDLRYRGRYLARDKEWRDSWGCDVCGILTTVSSEASVLILTIITLDRYMCILYPLKMRKRSLTFAYITMLVIWCACVALAVLPVMRLSYFGNYFYRNNAVCIPLFLHEPRGDGWEYSAFIFLGINMASFIFIAYAYAAMFLAIRRSRLMIRPADEHQERCLMKRFFFIVVTDLICWAPIMSLKAAALADSSKTFPQNKPPGSCQSTEDGSKTSLSALEIDKQQCPRRQRGCTGKFEGLKCQRPQTIFLRMMEETGVGISGSLYAWVVIFILPVNCALNPLLYTLTTRLFKQRLAAGLAQAMLRRRSLETHSSSSVSFTSLKSKSSSHRSGKDVNELDMFHGGRERIQNIYVGRMKYKYSHGRVIYPPGRAVTVPNGYKPVST
ncbi:hypothetical protein BaRGS_00008717, partial [Batillaria attramentaria]